MAELRLAAEAAGVSSISREEGRLVVRFGAGLTRAAAMRLLGDGGLPGVRPTDVTFASNQVRIRAADRTGSGMAADAGGRGAVGRRGLMSVRPARADDRDRVAAFLAERGMRPIARLGELHDPLVDEGLACRGRSR